MSSLTRPELVALVDDFLADAEVSLDSAAEASIGENTVRELRKVFDGYLSERLTNTPEFIVQAAAILRPYPELVRNLNVLLEALRFEERLELVMGDDLQGELIVVKASSGASIYDLSGASAPAAVSGVTNTAALRVALDQGSLDIDWANSGPSTWSRAVAELLQHEIKRNSANKEHKTTCLRHLRRLANKYGIFPPSFFLHNLTCGDDTNPLYEGAFAVSFLQPSPRLLTNSPKDVHKGTFDGGVVCLKILRSFTSLKEMRQKFIRDCCRETLVWKQLDHPNLLPFLGVSMDLFAPSLCLVSPWLSKGNLMEYIKRHPNFNRLDAIIDIASAMQYLHQHTPSIIHSDIRGANVLVMDNLRCCLADFGISLLYQSLAAANRSTNTRWQAPEAFLPSIEGRPPNQKARDVYAFACTVLEIYTGHVPFAEHKNDPAVKQAVMSGRRPSRPRDLFTDQLWQLIEECWNQRPDSRPSARHILRALQTGPSNKPSDADRLVVAESAETHRTVKNFKLDLQDPTWKIMPATLRKYGISDLQWESYAMFLCYDEFGDDGDATRRERCLSYDEKPMLLFQKLKNASQNPALTVKHIKDIPSPITLGYKKRAMRRAEFGGLNPPAMSSSSRLSQTTSDYTILGYAVAVYPYVAEQPDEFDISVGDIFVIVSRGPGVWWQLRHEPVRSHIDEVARWAPSGAFLETNIPVASAIIIATNALGWDFPLDTLSNRKPIMPSNIVSAGTTGIALAAYKPAGEEELELVKDCPVRLFKRYHHWSYAVKEDNGDRGWVPSWLIGKVLRPSSARTGTGASFLTSVTAVAPMRGMKLPPPPDLPTNSSEPKNKRWSTWFRDKSPGKKSDKIKNGQADLPSTIGHLTATGCSEWSLILDVCNRASQTEETVKEAVKALQREFKNGESFSAVRLWAMMLRNSSELFISYSKSQKILDKVKAFRGPWVWPPTATTSSQCNDFQLVQRPRDWRGYYAPQTVTQEFKRGYQSDVRERRDLVPRVLVPLFTFSDGYGYDLRREFSRSPLFLRVQQELDCAKPATNPPTEFLRLYHPRFPWYIDIAQSQPQGVTVLDILTKLHVYMQTGISSNHFYNEALGDLERVQIANACRERCSKNRISPQQILRVDFFAIEGKCISEQLRGFRTTDCEWNRISIGYHRGGTGRDDRQISADPLELRQLDHGESACDAPIDGSQRRLYDMVPSDTTI
ncbi:hypothetical protein C8J56DRAFT_1027479 [Mycena floridula]|nr:hypothetical protein C8J56DRAFT_1027479 [Mycena floridula]